MSPCGTGTCQLCKAVGVSPEHGDLQTPDGNVLWDCLSHLDEETLQQIRALGGLQAIAISQPHFYYSCLDWAEAFNCLVRLSAECMKESTTDTALAVQTTATGAVHSGHHMHVVGGGCLHMLYSARAQKWHS